ncbi:MAG: hypothetical protein LBE18_07375 [Planctomycetaceae bacterium]|nr:hypothetical protein [Planctomycetaceae bacterium]
MQDRGRLDRIFRRFLYKKDAGGTPAFPAKIFFSNSLKSKITKSDFSVFSVSSVVNKKNNLRIYY